MLLFSSLIFAFLNKAFAIGFNFQDQVVEEEGFPGLTDTIDIQWLEDLGVTSWSDWSSCTTECGPGGFQYRMKCFDSEQDCDISLASFNVDEDLEYKNHGCSDDIPCATPKHSEVTFKVKMMISNATAWDDKLLDTSSTEYAAAIASFQTKIDEWEAAIKAEIGSDYAYTILLTFEKHKYIEVSQDVQDFNNNGGGLDLGGDGGVGDSSSGGLAFSGLELPPLGIGTRKRRTADDVKGHLVYSVSATQSFASDDVPTTTEQTKQNLDTIISNFDGVEGGSFVSSAQVDGVFVNCNIDNGGCAQTCNSDMSTHFCECNLGYTLDPVDEKRCSASGDAQLVICYSDKMETALKKSAITADMQKTFTNGNVINGCTLYDDGETDGYYWLNTTSFSECGMTKRLNEEDQTLEIVLPWNFIGETSGGISITKNTKMVYVCSYSLAERSLSTNDLTTTGTTVHGTGEGTGELEFTLNAPASVIIGERVDVTVDAVSPDTGLSFFAKDCTVTEVTANPNPRSYAILTDECMNDVVAFGKSVSQSETQIRFNFNGFSFDGGPGDSQQQLSCTIKLCYGTCTLKDPSDCA